MNIDFIAVLHFIVTVDYFINEHDTYHNMCVKRPIASISYIIFHGIMKGNMKNTMFPLCVKQT